ncbi:Rv3235 family protein [Dactylosporangium sp. NPDC051485]|uniref:Rv3235 family protein n=1 Tax=Dactylosporangium sp. NPDC051485 TaxID=3154846 RepID=UPI00341FCEF6
MTDAVVLRVPPALDPPWPSSTPDDPLPFEWPKGGPPPALAVPPPRRPPRPAPLPLARSTAHMAAQRFASLCVEILNGYRPPSQLRPMTHPQRFTDVSDQIMRRTVRIRMSPGQAARHGRLVRARRMLLSEPLAGVAEAVVVLEQGETAWAMAIRFERSDRPGFGAFGWVCTLVQVV